MNGGAPGCRDLPGCLLKWGIALALAANTVLFGEYGRLSELIDSLAWLTLLLLFILETDYGARLGPKYRTGMRLARLPASALVLWAATAYVLENEWLDAANAWLWVAAVLLLEAELRWPPKAARWRRGYVGLSTVVYGGLFCFVLVWLMQGEWLDAWDAALWLAAFLLVELDLLRRLSAQTAMGSTRAIAR